MRPGFRDPPLDAARCYRALLEAMARPGRVTAPPDLPETPDGLTAGMGAALLTLADQDTPLWLDPGASDEVRRWLRFHCGCPLTDDPARAVLGCVLRPEAMPPLDAFAQGRPEYPDRSATLLLAVRALGDQQGARPVALRGPGVETVQRLDVSGLPEDFWTQWRANAARFPLGVDVFFVSADRVAGLPRSAQAEVTPCTSR